MIAFCLFTEALALKSVFSLIAYSFDLIYCFFVSISFINQYYINSISSSLINYFINYFLHAHYQINVSYPIN